VKILSECQTA